MTTIDQQQYDELRRIMGSDIDVLVASFERDCQQRIADAQDAFAASDFERLRRIAHTLKGGALGMAALALAEECKCLEGAAKDTDSAAANLALRRVEEHFATTLRVLRERC